MKLNIANMQKNSKCRLYSDKDKMIWSYNKWIQQNEHKWSSKRDITERERWSSGNGVWNWNLTNYQMYEHKPESVLENKTHIIFLDFVVWMDHLIPARRLNLVLINKKRTCCLIDFAISVDYRVKIKESEMIDK